MADIHLRVHRQEGQLGHEGNPLPGGKRPADFDHESGREDMEP